MKQRHIGLESLLRMRDFGSTPAPMNSFLLGLGIGFLPLRMARHCANAQGMAGLKPASIATHVADAKTCILHPAPATHRQMNDAELEAAGVSPDLVHLSVGLEDLEDLIADVAQALEGV